MTKRETFLRDNLQHQSYSLTFLLKNKSLLATTCVLSQWPNLLTYNSTAPLNKLPYTNYVDFGKCQDGFGQFACSTNDSRYLDVKLKVIKKVNNKDFRRVYNFTLGEADFRKFMRLRNQLVLAAEKFDGEKKCPLCWYQQCPKTGMNNLY